MVKYKFSGSCILVTNGWLPFHKNYNHSVTLVISCLNVSQTKCDKKHSSTKHGKFHHLQMHFILSPTSKYILIFLPTSTQHPLTTTKRTHQEQNSSKYTQIQNTHERRSQLKHQVSLTHCCQNGLIKSD